MEKLFKLARRHRVVAALLFVLQTSPAAAEVRAAVAANFLNCARELGTAFTQETGIPISIRFAATGTLYAQIHSGAPFDVFLAADQQRPAAAIAAGLAEPGSRITYAIGRLVLYSEALDVQRGLSMFDDAGTRRLAIANPTTAPYGAAAVAVLKALGRLASWREQLVRGNNLAQTFQFVASGNAELGLVASSQVVDVAADRWWTVPDHLHPALIQDAVLLSAADNRDAGHRFLEFLSGEQGQEIIRAQGYDTPR